MRVAKNKMKNGLILRGEVWHCTLKVNGRWTKRRLKATSYLDAVQERKDLQKEIDGNWGRGIRRISFEALANKWIETQKPSAKANTLAFYEIQLKALKQFFGSKEVHLIYPDDVEAFKKKAINEGFIRKDKNGQPLKDSDGNIVPPVPLSPTTCNHGLRVLRQVLDAGLRWGHLQKNPVLSVKKLKERKHQFEILDRTELATVLDALDTLGDPQGKVLIMTAATTGMRMSEILGMKWRHLDTKACTYTIKEAYTELGGFDSPKTQASQRTVVLPKELVMALEKHKKTQNEHCLKLGELYQREGLIFATELGTPLSPSNVRNRILGPALDEAEIKKTVRFHDLRRTYTSLALEAESNLKHVQAQLGHTSLNMTLGVYAQITDAKKREEVSKLSNYVFGKPLVEAIG